MPSEYKNPLSTEKGFGSLVVRVDRSSEMPDGGAETQMGPSPWELQALYCWAISAVGLQLLPWVVTFI